MKLSTPQAPATPDPAALRSRDTPRRGPTGETLDLLDASMLALWNSLRAAGLPEPIAAALPSPPRVIPAEPASTAITELIGATVALASGTAPSALAAPTSTSAPMLPEVSAALERIGFGQSAIDGALVLVASPSTSRHPSATVEIEHPELGRIQLRIDFSDDAVNVQATTGNAAAAAVLRASETALRRSMADKGLTMRSLRVDTASDPDHSEPRLRSRKRRPLDMEA